MLECRDKITLIYILFCFILFIAVMIIYYSSDCIVLIENNYYSGTIINNVSNCGCKQ